MSTLSQRLAAAWKHSVDSGRLINRFQAAADDPDKRWKQGDWIVFGVRCVKGENSLPKNVSRENAYYAQNETQSRLIPGAVEEKVIPELGFICQYNGYRALRPGGALKPLGKQADISAAPEDCRFSCQDSSDPLSLLVREPLVQVPLSHYLWNAYYNAAPIDPNGHFLWVPKDVPKGIPKGIPKDVPEDALAGNSELTHYPQQLSLAFLSDAIALYQQLDNMLLFFNSLHSGASVNHIHFQAIAHSTPLPVETWPLIQTSRSYAILKDYPANVMAFGCSVSPDNLFRYIDRFQQNGTPFNLMFAGSQILLIPRNIEHEIVSEFPGNGIAALGMCGKIITVDRHAYETANKRRITSAFEKMTILSDAGFE